MAESGASAASPAVVGERRRERYLAVEQRDALFVLAALHFVAQPLAQERLDAFAPLLLVRHAAGRLLRELRKHTLALFGRRMRRKERVARCIPVRPRLDLEQQVFPDLGGLRHLVAGLAHEEGAAAVGGALV